MKVLVTGAAGFIGFHITRKLLTEGYEVVGIDNINDYYDLNLKYARLQELGVDKSNLQSTNPKLKFIKLDISDTEKINNLFESEKFDYVINLAAQAGVRYQYENPYAYVSSNLVGFVNLMEAVRKYPVKHFLYASSSSVYGLNTQEVFNETDAVDHPASLYASTKRANELMAHSYSNLFDIPTTGLRFFTVYGPWGRPDMLMYKLADSAFLGSKVTMYQENGKSLERDYTYVEDIIEGIFKLLKHIPEKSENIDSPNKSTAPFAVYNIGKGAPDSNEKVIKTMEEYLGLKMNIEYAPAPKTEVFKTFASAELLKKEIGYEPKVGVEEGIRQFLDWYKKYNS